MSLIKKISLFLKKNQSADEVNVHDYVGKFVKQNGIDIGESIAFEERRIILKSSDGFMSIPFEAVVKNAENIVVGDFKREECIRLGKEWFERKDTLRFDEHGMLIK